MGGAENGACIGTPLEFTGSNRAKTKTVVEDSTAERKIDAVWMDARDMTRGRQNVSRHSHSLSFGAVQVSLFFHTYCH